MADRNDRRRVLILTDLEAAVLDEGAYVIRCPSREIWDGYGSFIRGVLRFVYMKRIERIEVIWTSDKSGPEQWREQMKEYGITEESLNCADYLMKYVHGIDPSQWFEEKTALENVITAVALLEQHPLLPKHVAVEGFLYVNDTRHIISEKGLS